MTHLISLALATAFILSALFAARALEVSVATRLEGLPKKVGIFWCAVIMILPVSILLLLGGPLGIFHEQSLRNPVGYVMCWTVFFGWSLGGGLIYRIHRNNFRKSRES
jgi:hypothetical protein